MSDVRNKSEWWVCGAHGLETFTGLIDFGKTCLVCDSVHERNQRATVEAVLREERDRGGPAVSPAPVPGCPGCGIRRDDGMRAKELEYAVRDLLNDAKLLGTNESHGLHGTCIAEIDRRVWDKVRTTWAEITGRRPPDDKS